MSRPFVIVIGGAFRSASTWQFNAVRLLLEPCKTVEWGVWRGEYESWSTLPDVDVLIIKEHRYYADLARIADMVFTTERDWNEAAASWERFAGKPLTLDEVRMRRQWLRAWKAHERHVCHLEYQEVVDVPAACFTLVATALEDLVHDTVLYLGFEEAFAKLEALQPPEIGQDDDTLMFSNHRTGP